MAEKTPAQKKAQQKYMEKFVRVEIRMEAEKRSIIQAHADSLGESVNAFINRAIDHEMARDGGSSPQGRGGASAEAGAVSLPTEEETAAQQLSEGE